MFLTVQNIKNLSRLKRTVLILKLSGNFPEAVQVTDPWSCGPLQPLVQSASDDQMLKLFSVSARHRVTRLLQFLALLPVSYFIIVKKFGIINNDLINIWSKESIVVVNKIVFHHLAAPPLLQWQVTTYRVTINQDTKL